MDINKLYSDENINENEDFIDSLVKNSAMFIYKTIDKCKKYI